MSTDKTCIKCEELVGDDGGDWNVWPKGLCWRCKQNLTSRFNAFFGVDTTSDHSGIQIDWPDVDRILGRIKRDYLMHVSYLVTDKDLYSRTVITETPIDKGEEEHDRK